MYAKRSGNHHRNGYTLVEILVVVGLLLILAMISVAVIPGALERHKTYRGGDQLQGWLLLARQWARRDGVPVGIRIQAGTKYPTTASPSMNYRHDLQYIQQPDVPKDPLSPSGFYIQGTTASAFPLPYVAGTTTAVQVKYSDGTAVDFCNGADPLVPDQSVWIAQKPSVDYLTINGYPYAFAITNVITNPADPPPVPPSPPKGDVLVLSRAFAATDPDPTGQTYHIYRSARILTGENALQMPDEVVIDTTMNAIFANTIPTNPITGNLDLVFSPNGGVIGQGGSTPVSDKVIFWVRDVTKDPFGPTPGDQGLVTVYVRTGFIAAHPVDTSINTTLSADAASGSTTITVASTSLISVGTTLYLLDTAAPTTNTEAVTVSAIAGTTLTLAAPGLTKTHTAALTQVRSDPYSFTRDGRSSGI